jgi:L-aspartate oxidase
MVLQPSSQDDIYAGKVEIPTLPELQKLMWEKVGLTRDAAGLGDALLPLNSWEVLLSETVSTERAQLELKNLVTLGRLMVIAALTRTESRGAHYRRDYPALDPAWKKHITIGG